MQKHNVDLKWSLWMASEAEFAERVEEGVLDDMKKAFAGEIEECQINTAPKKEIRYGKVNIYEGGAHVELSYEWDEPYEFLDRLAMFVDESGSAELTEEESEQATDDIAEYFSEVQFYVDEEVEATDFADLMEKIDAVETKLIEREKKESAGFDSYLRKLGRGIRKARAESGEEVETE